MRIRKFGCHEESKVSVINDFILSKFHQQGSSLLLGIFLKNRLKEGIQSLLNVLQHTRRTKSDTGLNRSLVVFTTELNHLQVRLVVLLLEPEVGLILGIDDQGPTMAVVDDDGVVNGELICGEAVHLPFSDHELVGKNTFYRKGL